MRLRVVYQMHRRGEGACKTLLRVARVGHEPDDIILKRIAVFDLPRTSTSTYSTWPQSSSRIVITVTRLSVMR